jgi:hypothetical protein
MMRRWSSARRALFAPVALFAVVACAGTPKDPAASPATSGPVVDPPQMSRGTAPQLRIPASYSGRAPVRVQIEVMIDADGRPDMRTFKAVGLGADINRDALYAWIESASFRPARIDGRSVPGLFKMELQASVRRM